MNTTAIAEIIKDVQAGRMVIIVDEESREDECDLVIAAEKITPDAINFMSKYGRGLICLTLTRQRCHQLELPLMISNTDNRLSTNFTVSIDAKDGITTGISAHDRAHTICVATAADAKSSELIHPGHIFPLMEQPGGVLTRAGHTEAGCDLVRLAGMEPAAVIVEILNEDGTMARRKDIDRFAAKHNLKIGTIEDLIRYRIEDQRTVNKICQKSINTDYGEFMLHIYEDQINHIEHLALTRGEIAATEPVLVRVHIEHSLRDVIGMHSQTYGWLLNEALQRIDQENKGVFVLLRLPDQIARLDLQLEKLLEDQDKTQTLPQDRWTHGIGGQILKDLGVGKMRLMSSPQHFHNLGGFGLSIEEYINKQDESHERD